MDDNELRPERWDWKTAKELRTSAKITQRQAEEMLGVSSGYWSLIERPEHLGGRTPLGMLEKWGLAIFRGILEGTILDEDFPSIPTSDTPKEDGQG